MAGYKGFCIAIIGTNETGKTTFMMDIIKSYKRNVLVLMDDDSEDSFDNFSVIENKDIPFYRGKAVCLVDYSKKAKKEVFKIIYDSFGQNTSGGLLCFDDAMSFLSSRDEEVMRIFKKRRQRQMDIILNCHGASEYPVNLIRNTTHFVICPTTDSISEIKKRISPSIVDDFVRCVNHVNEIGRTNPYYKVSFNLKDPKDIQIVCK